MFIVYIYLHLLIAIILFECFLTSQNNNVIWGLLISYESLNCE